MAAQKGVSRVADRQMGGWVDGGICQPLMMSLHLKFVLATTWPALVSASSALVVVVVRRCISHTHTQKGLSLCVCVFWRFNESPSGWRAALRRV